MEKTSSVLNCSGSVEIKVIEINGCILEFVKDKQVQILKNT